MVRAKTEPLDATFAALSDPTRRAILDRLSRGPATVGELAEPFSMSLPAISKHIKVLETAGLIERTRSGRNYHCSLRSEPLQAAAGWIAEYRSFWERSLRSLDRYLKTAAGSDAKSAKSAGKSQKDPRVAKSAANSKKRKAAARKAPGTNRRRGGREK